MSAAPEPRPHARPATEADVAQVCDLLRRCYPRNPKADPDVYAWQYWRGPFGPSHPHVWETDGRVVAHAGLYEVPGSAGTQALRLGRTADAATDAAHRGRGLFGSLARRTLEAGAADGLDATLILPTPEALHGYEGAGMVTAGRADRWVRILTDPPHLPALLAGAVRLVVFGALPRPDGGEVDGPPDGLDDLDGAAEAGIRREPAWWRWRYVQRPAGSYRWFAQRHGGRLTAAAVTAVADWWDRPFCHVMDLVAVDVSAAAGLLGAVVAGHEHAAGVTLLAGRRSRAAEWARAAGFRRLPAVVDDTSGDVGVVPHRPATPVLAGLPWALSWGVHDHL